MRYFEKIVPVRSKIQEIPGDILYPHYSDERFYKTMGAKTIFLAQGLATVREYETETVRGAHYNYSDRIWQGFANDLVERAYQEAAEEIGNKNTAAYYEAMLKKVYEDPSTELQHIAAGVNAHNGYSYHVYGTVSRSDV